MEMFKREMFSDIFYLCFQLYFVWQGSSCTLLYDLLVQRLFIRLFILFIIVRKKGKKNPCYLATTSAWLNHVKRLYLDSALNNADFLPWVTPYNFFEKINKNAPSEKSFYDTTSCTKCTCFYSLQIS